nr:ABC transporter ATP-binding protein [Desulfobacterales bacterium]
MGLAFEIKSISFRYEDSWVLKDISFEVHKAEFLGIIGPNGSGKTSLLKLMDKILLPQKGSIYLDGIDLKDINQRDIARKIGVVAQSEPFLSSFSVFDVVLMGRSPYLSRFQFEGRHDFEIVHDALRLTETDQLSKRMVGNLSGGEQQRVLIARALAQEPEILLLDEPTSHLDLKHQVGIFELLKHLNQTSKITVVMVSHDINFASQFCDRLILLKEGRIAGQGRPQEVITEEIIRSVYEVPVLVDQNPYTRTPRVTPYSLNRDSQADNIT